MTAKQVHKNKYISFTNEIFNKYGQCHMLISDQDYKTLECKIEYTKVSVIVSSLTMI